MRGYLCSKRSRRVQSVKAPLKAITNIQNLPRQGTGVVTPLGWRRIQRTRRVLLVLPWLSLAWQMVLAQTAADRISALLAASGSFLVFFDAFRPRRLYRYPLSTLLVLGFGVTLQLGPLYLTALEGHSITFNLLVPVATFGHGVLSSLVCLVAHAIYRQSPWSRQLRANVQRVLHQLKLFQPLRTAEAVAMGLLGVIALAFMSWFSGPAEGNVVLTKFIQGFQFLSVIPATLLLQGLWSTETYAASARTRKPLVLFLLFTVLIALACVGRNARGPALLPLTCLFIGLALEWLYGLIRLRLVPILAVGLAIFLLLPLVTDLATAMVMVRGQRSYFSASELLVTTFDQLQDRDAIQRYRLTESEMNLTADWSENYVSNLFLARFANAKYPDNSLENASRVPLAGRDEMAAYQWLRLLTTLPSPLLSILGISNATKLELLNHSFGDKLFSLAVGSYSGMGSHRTGHFFGTGIAGFGFGYLLILFAGLLLTFPLLDSHALVSAAGSYGSPLISVVALTQLFNWFTISNTESVVMILAFPIRVFLEPVILFALVRLLLVCVRAA
jgi:hypothetical protein